MNPSQPATVSIKALSGTSSTGGIASQTGTLSVSQYKQFLEDMGIEGKDPKGLEQQEVSAVQLRWLLQKAITKDRVEVFEYLFEHNIDISDLDMHYEGGFIRQACITRPDILRCLLSNTHHYLPPEIAARQKLFLLHYTAISGLEKMLDITLQFNPCKDTPWNTKKEVQFLGEILRVTPPTVKAQILQVFFNHKFFKEQTFFKKLEGHTVFVEAIKNNQWGFARTIAQNLPVDTLPKLLPSDSYSFLNEQQLNDAQELLTGLARSHLEQGLESTEREKKLDSERVQKIHKI